MEHFFNEDGYYYGVKETFGKDGLVAKWEKVSFNNRDLWDTVDGLVEKEIPHDRDRKSPPVNFYGDSRIKEGAAPFVLFMAIRTREFTYSIYKTEEERDGYYNKFNN